MGCPVCQQQANLAAAAPQNAALMSEPNPECPYTEEQLEEWRRLLLCVRDNGYREELRITEGRLNSAVGIVVSGINHKWNICYFDTLLADVAPLIILIINSGKCT